MACSHARPSPRRSASFPGQPSNSRPTGKPGSVIGMGRPRHWAPSSVAGRASAHDGLGTDNGHSVHDVRKQPIERVKQNAGGASPAQTLWRRSAWHGDLAPQSQALGLQPLTRLEPRSDCPKQRFHDPDHRSRPCHRFPSRRESAPDCIFGRYSSGQPLGAQFPAAWPKLHQAVGSAPLRPAVNDARAYVILMLE